MAAATVTFREYAGLLGKVEKGAVRAAAIRGLHWAALRGKNYLVTTGIPQTQPHPPVDRGTYKAAWNVETLPEGAMLYNDEQHALFIEYGVRAENVKPGRAMIQALREWALRKGLASDEKEAASLAWAIATSMKRRGIFNRAGWFGAGKGLGILQSLVVRQLPQFVKEEVTREVKAALSSLGGTR